MNLSADFVGWSKEMLASRIISLEAIIAKVGVPGHQFTDPIAEVIPALTQMECRVLVALADGEARSREAIHGATYLDRPDTPAIDRVDVLVSNLRKKLAGSPISIKTNPGRAFQLQLDGGAVVTERRSRGDALDLVLAAIKTFVRPDGFCRFTTLQMVKATGIKGKLAVALATLQRRQFIRIRERPNRREPRAVWLIYLRTRARG
jgi:hypothetical protein